MAKTATNKKKKKGMSASGIVLIVLLVVAIGLGGTIFYLKYQENQKEELRQELLTAGVFRKGVNVSGIDIGGLTYEQAESTLAAVETELVRDIGFTLNYADVSYEINEEYFDFTYNTDEILDEAILLASEGDLETIQAEIADIEMNGREYTIKYEVKLKDISQFIAKIAEKIDVAPVDATFAVKQLDMNSETNTNNAIDVGLPEDGSVTDLRDVRFEFTEATKGTKVDTAALIKTLETLTEQRKFGTEIEIPITESEAEKTVDTIKQSLVLRSSADTFYGKTPYNRDTRVHNLKKAAGLVYGTVIMPGEEFSMNTILGNRTEAGGWQLAPAVIDGGAANEDQAGGGVCQVSSTIYNAVLKSDLNIVYRQPHSSKLSYVPGGLDATIDSGRIDFKWSNNTTEPIYVFTWIDTKEKYVRCELYGLPFDGAFDEIQLVSEQLDPILPTEPEYIENASLVSPYWMLKNESKKGYVFQTYAVYMKEGAELERKEIALTQYRMHPTRYYVWPGYIAGTPLLDMYKLTPAPTPAP